MDYYELQGRNFDYVSDDAVGFIATSNDNPLRYKDNQTPDFLYDIVEKTNTYMKLKQKTVGPHAYNSYMGGLISADRQTIYWTNDTQPLP